MATLREDQPFPQFRLPRAGGPPLSKADLAGRPFVLYLYPKDGTPGCTSEAKDFSDLAAEFTALETAVIGVSPDSTASHERFIAKHGLGMVLLADEDQTLAQALGVWVEKSMYGRRYMGVERTTFLVDGDGTVRRVWEKVKVPGHAQAVLDEVRALRSA